MKRVPTRIAREGTSGITISWSTGDTSSLSTKTLRLSCPCALCREQRGDTSHAEPLTAQPAKKVSSLQIIESTIDESLTLEEIAPVGNYAVKLRWKDGHNDGIYSFKLLAELDSALARD